MTEASIECTGKDMFVVFNGIKIAKRGRRRGQAAWISLEPGFTVRDLDGGAAIEVEYKAPRGRLNN